MKQTSQGRPESLVQGEEDQNWLPLTSWKCFAVSRWSSWSRFSAWSRDLISFTDESSLRDFKGVEDLELPDIHRRIREVYGIDVSGIVSGNLVEVFARIHEHTYDQHR